MQASLTVLGRGGFAPLASRRIQLDLHSVDLRQAQLVGTHLAGANLTDAYLAGARLGGAHLEQAYLDGAHLEGAFVNEHTVWPAGFDWRAAGIIMAGEDAADRPPQPA